MSTPLNGYARARMMGWLSGTTLLAIGLAMTPTPIPLGLVVAASGLTLLLMVSARLRRIVRARRRRHAWVHASMSALGRVAPGRLGRILSTIGAGPRYRDGTQAGGAR
ncbi:hypothetical protein [Maricaulis sp. CAU 1757]